MSNGKGSWPRPRFVSSDTYGDNYDRIFGKGQSKPEPKPGPEEGEPMTHCPTTVGELKKMLADLPKKLDGKPILVHVAAKDGWAAAPIKPMIGRASQDEFVMLSAALPDELEQYAEEGNEAPPLRVIK